MQITVINLLLLYIIIQPCVTKILKRKQTIFDTFFLHPAILSEYPFGDEYFNKDMKSDHTQQEFEPIHRDEESIFIDCPAYNIHAKCEHTSILNELCEKCDVNYGLKYIITCFKCRPTSNPTAMLTPEKCVSSHYLEIANYTEPN